MSRTLTEAEVFTILETIVTPCKGRTITSYNVDQVQQVQFANAILAKYGSGDVSEREARARERAAWIACTDFLMTAADPSRRYEQGRNERDRRYPLPVEPAPVLTDEEVRSFHISELWLVPELVRMVEKAVLRKVTP